MGRIVELKKRNDEFVRAANVKLSNGKIFRRPVNLLYPLEVNDEDVSEDKIEVVTGERIGKEPLFKDSVSHVQQQMRVQNITSRQVVTTVRIKRRQWKEMLAVSVDILANSRPVLAAIIFSCFFAARNIR
ncbi:unnamed protein product [Gongylonema pulchrum]|uniref:Transmembrane protein n=1 Tax=Gongylonema pulchrum TaxID=637853 RepID=A0A183DNA8_9BILA|nr:unnamed protein product [Gongylonema pulchrum]